MLAVRAEATKIHRIVATQDAPVRLTTDGSGRILAMSESRSTLETSELPCMHCGTVLSDEVRFCFECGAPVVPAFNLPSAPAGALDELATAAFSSVSIRPIDEDEGPQPGEPIEIESLGFEVVVDEVPIDLSDVEGEGSQDEGAASEPARPPKIEDPSSRTVVAMAPEHPLPFWPAPPKGETVVAPAPTAPTGSG